MTANSFAINSLRHPPTQPTTRDPLQPRPFSRGACILRAHARLRVERSLFRLASWRENATKERAFSLDLCLVDERFN